MYLTESLVMCYSNYIIKCKGVRYMKLFENKVGRPSNEIKRHKKQHTLLMALFVA